MRKTKTKSEYMKTLRKKRNGFVVSTTRKLGKRAHVNVVFKQYKQSALKRGYSWDLHKYQIEALIFLPCYFCGKEVASGFRHGIDRLNNEKGYMVDNVVPCCRICNLMKGVQTEQMFLQHCAKIAQNAENRRKPMMPLECRTYSDKKYDFQRPI